MIGLLLLSLLTLLGAAVTWWLRQPPADPGGARPVSIPLSLVQVLLPVSDKG